MGTFDNIKEGLDDALAFAEGDESRGKVHVIDATKEGAHDQMRELMREYEKYRDQERDAGRALLSVVIRASLLVCDHPEDSELSKNLKAIMEMPR